jgi:two-component system sensor histidine kinase BaeS
MPILLVSLALALISAVLCFDARPGLNWPLFVIPATIGLYLFTKSTRPEAARAILAPLALAALLSTAAAITASDFNHALIFLSNVVLLTTATRLAAGAPLSRAGAAFIAASPPVAALQATRESWSRLADSAQHGDARRSLPIVRGLLLALPIVIVLWLLLATADPHLERWATAVREAIATLAFVPRLIFGLASFVLLFGAYTLASRPAEPSAELFAEPHPEQYPVSFAPTERTIVLASVAALFALFVALQITAYLGDPAALAGSGITYAEWARRGFGELATAAALVTLLIVALDRFAVRGDARAEHRARLTALVLVALTALITLSALRRVALYEAAYGYTTARIEAQFFMAGVGIALALLATELRATVDARRFARRSALAAAALITLFVHWNHDAFIVRRNVQRFAGTEKLDVRYLTLLLSPDALPALIAARGSLGPKQDSLLNSCLARRLENGRDHDLQPGRWFELNTRRSEALTALDAAKPLGDPSACGYTSD